MSLKFRLYQNANSKSEYYQKWYGKAFVKDVVTTEELASLITDRCTVTDTDTLAVLHALAKVMKTELQDGKRVKLDYLGAFKLGISSSPAETAETFNVDENVKGAHIIFQPETRKKDGRRVKTLLEGLVIAELPSDSFDRKKEKEKGKGKQNAADPQNP